MPLSRRAGRSSSTDLEKSSFKLYYQIFHEAETIGIALAGSRNLFEDCLEEVNNVKESFNDLTRANERSIEAFRLHLNTGSNSANESQPVN